jgi:hypothetical protein
MVRACRPIGAENVSISSQAVMHSSCANIIRVIITRSAMTDPHQMNTIIASALLDCFKQRKDRIDPEEAKLIAKCIVLALNEAGFQIAPYETN